MGMDPSNRIRKDYRQRRSFWSSFYKQRTVCYSLLRKVDFQRRYNCPSSLVDWEIHFIFMSDCANSDTTSWQETELVTS